MSPIKWPDADHPVDDDGRCIYDCPEHYDDPPPEDDGSRCSDSRPGDKP